MIIAVDIGNSSIKTGLFSNGELLVKSIPTWPVPEQKGYAGLINGFIKEINKNKFLEGSIICSVVSGHTDIIYKAIKQVAAPEPLVVSYRMNTGLTFSIPEPQELGADRIANVTAVNELFKCPAAVVDCGTATTLSITGSRADYIGGAIMPGIKMMKESLSAKTSRLPDTEIVRPGSALGTDTKRCIQSGTVYGTAGAVERLLEEAENETGLRFKTVVTGGYGSLVSGFLRRQHQLEPHLTLMGLRILYLRNYHA